MSEQRSRRTALGMVRYEAVSNDYLDRRQLRRSAGWGLLWALGVGAVISGAFSGWNFGLEVGGFGGLAIATLLMAVMYVCLVYSLAELSAALPHTGGLYSFTRHAFGPLGGFICGVAETVEYVVTSAVIVFFIGSYLGVLLPNVPPPVWWILFYTTFVLINIRGVELTLKVGLVITAIALAVLAIFFISVIISGAFQPSLLFNIAPSPGNPAWLPFGWAGVFGALPYAIWFFLGVEELPLAAEEARHSRRSIPQALIWTITTLLGLALLVLVLNSGVSASITHLDTGETVTGAVAIARTTAPLVEGFRAIFGDGRLTSLLTLLAAAGLIASFHTVIYAYGRVLFALSRAGYYPRWLSVTNRHQTPAIALVLGGYLGLGCAAAIYYEANTLVGPALLTVVVFAAMISYVLALLSYIKLHVDYPELYRPYHSPLGVPGAIVGTVLATLALLACFIDPAYRPGVWGMAIFLIIMLGYFVLYSRKTLVARAPEEETALLTRALREIDQLTLLPK